MAIVLVSEQVLLNLLGDVRKAQKKLYNAHCSRSLISDLDWDIRVLEQTTYDQSAEMLRRFMEDNDLVYDKTPWED